MAEYLESLGPYATIGQAFDDLYGRVDTAITELEKIVETEKTTEGGSQRGIFPLGLYYSGAAEHGGWKRGARIESVYGYSRHMNLVGKVSQHFSDQDQVVPLRVEAWRQKELACGDYSMEVVGDPGLVTAKLG